MKHWTKESCVAALDEFRKEHKRYPNLKECCAANHLAAPATFTRHMEKTYTQYLSSVSSDSHCTKPHALKRSYLDRAFRQSSRKKYNAIGYWDRISCIEALDNFLQKHSRLPSRNEHGGKMGLPCESTFTKMVGQTYAEYCREHYNEYCIRKYPVEKWDESRILEAWNGFTAKYKRPPLSKEMISKYGLPSPHTIFLKLGMSINEFRKIYFSEYTLHAFHDKWTADEVKNGIQAFLDSTGRLPKFSDFRNENGLPGPDGLTKVLGMKYVAFCYLHFPNRASIDFKRGKTVFGPDECLAALERFIEVNGRFPKATEMNSQNGLPCYPTLKKNLNLRTLKEKYRYLEEKCNGETLLTEDAQKWNEPEMGIG